MSAAIPTDERGHSPFRAAVERKDIAGLVAALAPNVRLRSPVVFAPYEGREVVGALLGVVAEVLGPALRYQWQVREGKREVLCFVSQLGDREVEGVDILRYDDNGEVDELVVMVRPGSGLAALRDGMLARLNQVGGPEAA